MNIISNNCLGGWIYKSIINENFKNPFIWCFLDQYFELILNYKTINFNDFTLNNYGNTLKDTFEIIIENKYHLRYVHHIFDKKYTIPTIINNEVRYNKIWELIVNQYKTRLERMLKLNENPIFVYYANTILTKDQISIFEEKSNTNKVLIFTDTNTKLFNENKKLKVYNTPGIHNSPVHVVRKYHNEIKKFIME